VAFFLVFWMLGYSDFKLKLADDIFLLKNGFKPKNVSFN